MAADGRVGGGGRGGSGGSRAIWLSGSAVLASGAAVALAAAAAGDGRGGGVALAGGAVIAAVLVLATAVVQLVSGVAPGASMLVALLTYTLVVVGVGVAFGALARSGLVDDGSDRRWLAAAVLAGTLAWTVSQIVLARRARIPLYDLEDTATPVRGDGR